MHNLFSVFFMTLTMALLQSCNSGDFSGESSARRAAIKPKPKPAPVDPGTPIAPIDPSQPPAEVLRFDDGKMCISKNAQIDVNVMFVADVSASMNGTISTVAKNMRSIAESIGGIRQALGEKRIKDIRLGFIPYIDQLSDRGQNVVPLSTDIASAASSTVANAFDNGDTSDSAEGGLWAFGHALRLSKDVTAASQKTINIIFIATDAWSHDGSGCGPDCHARRTFNLSGVTAQLQDPSVAGLLVYDWSYDSRFSNGNGDFGDDTVGKYGSPRAQWEAVRNQFRAIRGSGAKSGGKNLGNPNIQSSQNIVTDIVSHINANIVGCP